MDTRVTMQDVAQVAGVSAKTVSNVLRGAGGASEETRQRVLAAAASLGYRINAGAAALRSGRHGAVALAVPTLQQPIFADLAAEVMQAATDLQVVLELTGGEREREAALLAGSWRSQCDALILLPRSITPGHDAADARGVVLVAEDGPTHLPRLSCSSASQTLLVAGHLHQLGRTRAAVLGVNEPADQWTETCSHGLQSAGIEVPPGAVLRLTDPDSVRSGVEAVARLLHCGPRVDAVVCHNDAVAAGAVTALQRHGARLPEDVVVIGRGDTETAAFASPGITSVSCGAQALAAELVRTVTAVLAGAPAPPPEIEVAPALTIRESSRRPAPTSS
ncbi:LacI family DNA-binding transcriptional regulator [Actinomyces faecalis]|uniref:LacI family DNA-binding transcriptional regulator n=1 Tax=Actinomyces faecalis TaxID=2722820 RepID=UPI0015571C54|nr:LacI family DNA-binding transcriptional regulator [Actinomyces faecalis]